MKLIMSDNIKWDRNKQERIVTDAQFQMDEQKRDDLKRRFLAYYKSRRLQCRNEVLNSDTVEQGLLAAMRAFSEIKTKLVAMVGNDEELQGWCNATMDVLDDAKKRLAQGILSTAKRSNRRPKRRR